MFGLEEPKGPEKHERWYLDEVGVLEGDVDRMQHREPAHPSSFIVTGETSKTMEFGPNRD